MDQIIPINATFAPLQALVDELARCGMTHAVTSPGSRNAPIALTLAGDERIEAVSVIDERCAGFVALGMAKASGRPVAVTCTSGSAAANLMPAVVEAHEARVPLIVLTADRPPELRDVGAGQAIDQVKLFGSAAKWFVEVGAGEGDRTWAVHMRALGCRAYWTAGGGRRGPVHLNLPLRDPLFPVSEAIDPVTWAGREDGSPWVRAVEHSWAPESGDVQVLAEAMAERRRGVIVCGLAHAAVADQVALVAARSGWPVLAEPTSGLRCGDHDRSQVISHYDVLLRSESFAASHAPEMVLRVGDTPTSKPLRAWLAGTEQVVLDPHAAWHEPSRMATQMLHADPARTCDAVAAALEMRAPVPDAQWLESWRRADTLVPGALAKAPDPFEPKAYAALADVVPQGSILWVASSMPIREVEAFFPSTERGIWPLSNRGANGIDGTISSAAGAALATGAPTFVLIGEVALQHDIGGLLAARRAGARLTVICTNNGGGGIFDFLPVAEHADRALYEEHVATGGDADLGAVATLAGLEHRTAATPDEVRAAVATPGLIEVRTDRADSVRLHRQLYERVAAQLSG